VSERVEGLAWQVGVWNRISQIYWSEIDRRFASVVDSVLARADLHMGERVLDIGTGTGAVAAKAAVAVGPSGYVLGIDISPEMLALAGRRADRAAVRFHLREGSADNIPVAERSFDVVLTSLTLMYVSTPPGMHSPASQRRCCRSSVSRKLRLPFAQSCGPPPARPATFATQRSSSWECDAKARQ